MDLGRGGWRQAGKEEEANQGGTPQGDPRSPRPLFLHRFKSLFSARIVLWVGTKPEPGGPLPPALTQLMRPHILELSVGGTPVPQGGPGRLCPGLEGPAGICKDRPADHCGALGVPRGCGEGRKSRSRAHQTAQGWGWARKRWQTSHPTRRYEQGHMEPRDNML